MAGNWKSKGTLGNNVYGQGLAQAHDMDMNGYVLFSNGIGFSWGRVDTSSHSTTVSPTGSTFMTYVLNITVSPTDTQNGSGSGGAGSGFGYAELDKYGPADWDNYDEESDTSTDHQFKILTWDLQSPEGIGHVNYFVIFKHDFEG